MADRYYSNADEGQRFQPGTTAEAGAVDQKFDEVTAGFQQVATDTDRSLKLPSEGDSKALTETPLQRRNKVVGFDADGALVLTAGFTWRGDWSTATEYFVNDVFRDAATKNLYVVQERHTSGTLADDITAGKSELAINVVDVEDAKDAAEAARDAAQTAETNASASESAAATSETNAAASEAAAATSETNAAASESAAATSETNAASSESAAATSESNASASETKAQEWAEQATDVEVEPGAYSAKHWAEKAQDAVLGDYAISDLEPAVWSSISANATLEANGWYAVDFTAGPLTLTLPAAPATHDAVRFYRTAGEATDTTLARNGSTIMGLAEDLVIDYNATSLHLVYNGTDWRVVS